MGRSKEVKSVAAELPLKSPGIELKIPFRDCVPPLATAEREELERQIVRAGEVFAPIVITTKREILDGHNRYEIAKKHGLSFECVIVRESEYWDDARKRFEVQSLAIAQRNLSHDQKRELEKDRSRVMLEMLKAGKTQAEVAEYFGVDRTRVSRLVPEVCGEHTTGKPGRVRMPEADARVKVNPKKKPEIAEAVKSGKTQAQVAADFGVCQQTVSNIVKEEGRKAAVKEKREEAAKERVGNVGVIHGDFRVGLLGEEDGSIDLILTDPPYDKGAVGLYREIAELAAVKLCPGGWLLAYTGQIHLPDVVAAFSTTEGLRYAWVFAALHKEGDQRIRNFKLLNGWKPIIAAYRPPLEPTWDWFRDVASGGREKDDHEWQQPEAEAAHFIERLCPKAGRVCDPCCGSGTVLSAAKKLGRRWLGFEIDAEHVETSRGRLQ